MVSLIQLKPSSVELAADSAHRREDIRPAEKQDPTYREKFDDRTLFYDCIAYRDGVTDRPAPAEPGGRSAEG